MKLKELYQKYQNRTVEDGGCYMSKEAMQYASDIESTLKTIAKENGFCLHSFTIGHYFVSGFFEKEGKFVYFSRDIERYQKEISLKSAFSILIRSARSDDDYSGGRNNYCNFDVLAASVIDLCENPCY